MGDGEEDLETPLPLPQSLDGRTVVRTDVRSLVRWRHNQIFSAWWVTNFPYPWCFAGALRALKLRYNDFVRTWNSILQPLLSGVPSGDEENLDTKKKYIR